MKSHNILREEKTCISTQHCFNWNSDRDFSLGLVFFLLINKRRYNWNFSLRLLYAVTINDSVVILDKIVNDVCSTHQLLLANDALSIRKLKKIKWARPEKLKRSNIMVLRANTLVKLEKKEEKKWINRVFYFIEIFRCVKICSDYWYINLIIIVFRVRPESKGHFILFKWFLVLVSIA